MRRLRPFQPVAKATRQTPAQPGRMDLWLQRSSLIAQPLLLLVALATIKLTVIPLYEKAQLDEALAKRELELERTTETLNARYSTLRRYVARSFAFVANNTCAYTDAEMAWMMTPPGEEPNGKWEAIEREKLHLDVASCLRKLASKSEVLGDLSTADRQALAAVFDAIGAAVAPIQEKATADYEAAPEFARKDPEKYLQDGANRKAVDAALQRLGVPLPPRNIEADAAAGLRRTIVSQYTSEVMDAIHKGLKSWSEMPPPVDGPSA